MLGWTLSHILTSQFLYIPNIGQKYELKKQELIIQTKKHKKIHYLYLWLLTGQNPPSAKFNFLKK